MFKDSRVVLAQHLRRPSAATAMLPKCATRRGTHAWCQFLCALPRVHVPARALVARACTATRELSLARFERGMGGHGNGNGDAQGKKKYDHIES